MIMKDAKANELQLGDTIKLFEGPWGHAVITQIKDGQVHWFRPYVHTDNFTYTGGIIPYIGIEQGWFPVTSNNRYELWDRKRLIE